MSQVNQPAITGSSAALEPRQKEKDRPDEDRFLRTVAKNQPERISGPAPDPTPAALAKRGGPKEEAADPAKAAKAGEAIDRDEGGSAKGERDAEFALTGSLRILGTYDLAPNQRDEFGFIPRQLGGGPDNKLSAGVGETRFRLGYKNPAAGVEAFFENDFVGNTFRIRDAYGTIQPAEGMKLGFGRQFTLFGASHEALNHVDILGGPGSVLGWRTGLRFETCLAPDLDLSASAEIPTVRTVGAEPADTGRPDLILRLDYRPDLKNSQVKLHASTGVLAHPIRAVAPDQREVEGSGFGWYLGFKGNLGPVDYNMKGHWLHGAGGITIDAPPDAVFNPDSGRLQEVTTIGFKAGLRVPLTPNLQLSGFLAQQNVLGHQALPGDSHSRSRQAAAGVSYAFNPTMALAAEGLYATHQTQDGKDRGGTRLGVKWTVNFGASHRFTPPEAKMPDARRVAGDELPDEPRTGPYQGAPSASPPSAGSAPAQEWAPPAPERRYVVKAKDTLSRIAKEIYGDPNMYRAIYEANKDILKRGPHVIHIGQALILPEQTLAARSK